MSEVIETTKDGRYRVVLEPDADCESPMNNDYCWNVSVFQTYVTNRWGNYESVVLYDPEGRIDAMRHFERSSLSDFTMHPDAAFIRYMSIFYGITVHEVTVGSEGIHGLAWVETSERERVGSTDDAENIQVSLEEYNSWARGECYGYVVEELVTWTRDDDSDIETYKDEWEPTDSSLWGLIGYEYAERSAREALAEEEFSRSAY